MAESFTRRRARMFALVIVPSLYPFVFATLRIMFGVAWKVTLTAELFGGNSGLGYMINLARQEFDTATIFAAIILIIAFVHGMDRYVLGAAAGERVASLCGLSDQSVSVGARRAPDRRGRRRARAARLVGRWRAACRNSSCPGRSRSARRLVELFVTPDFLWHAVHLGMARAGLDRGGAADRRRPRIPRPRRALARGRGRRAHQAGAQLVSLDRLGDPGGDLVRARRFRRDLRRGRDPDPVLPDQHRRGPAQHRPRAAWRWAAASRAGARASSGA